MQENTSVGPFDMISGTRSSGSSTASPESSIPSSLTESEERAIRAASAAIDTSQPQPTTSAPVRGRNVLPMPGSQPTPQPRPVAQRCRGGRESAKYEDRIKRVEEALRKVFIANQQATKERNELRIELGAERLQTARIPGLEREVGQLRTTVERQGITINRLQEELKSAKSTAATLKVRLHHAEERARTAEERAIAAEERASTYAREVKELRQQLKETQEHVKSLTVLLEKANARAEAAEAKMAALRKERDSARAIAEKLNGKLLKTLTEKEHYVKKSAHFKEELLASRWEVAGGNAHWRAAIDENKQLRSERDSLLTALPITRKRHTQRLAERDSARAIAETLNGKLLAQAKWTVSKDAPSSDKPVPTPAPAPTPIPAPAPAPRPVDIVPSPTPSVDKSGKPSSSTKNKKTNAKQARERKQLKKKREEGRDVRNVFGGAAVASAVISLGAAPFTGGASLFGLGLTGLTAISAAVGAWDKRQAGKKLKKLVR